MTALLNLDLSNLCFQFILFAARGDDNDYSDLVFIVFYNFYNFYNFLNANRLYIYIYIYTKSINQNANRLYIYIYIYKIDQSECKSINQYTKSINQNANRIFNFSIFRIFNFSIYTKMEPKNVILTFWKFQPTN